MMGSVYHYSTKTPASSPLEVFTHTLRNIFLAKARLLSGLEHLTEKL